MYIYVYIYERFNNRKGSSKCESTEGVNKIYIYIPGIYITQEQKITMKAKALRAFWGIVFTWIAAAKQAESNIPSEHVQIARETTSFSS